MVACNLGPTSVWYADFEKKGNLQEIVRVLIYFVSC